MDFAGTVISSSLCKKVSPQLSHGNDASGSLDSDRLSYLSIAGTLSIVWTSDRGH